MNMHKRPICIKVARGKGYEQTTTGYGSWRILKKSIICVHADPIKLSRLQDSNEFIKAIAGGEKTGNCIQ